MPAQNERGITEALTGDHHFVQAGFRALLQKWLTAAFFDNHHRASFQVSNALASRVSIFEWALAATIRQLVN